MLSKSAVFSIVFVLSAIVVAGLYAFGTFAAITQQFGFDPEYANLLACLVLLAFGVVLSLFGGHRKTITVTAIAFAFCLLVAQEAPLTRYMSLAALLFAIGAYGMVVSRNAVRMLMSIELMLNAVNVNMVALARYIDPVAVRGQLFAIFVLTIAAAEAAVGLAIVLAIYRNNATIDMDKFSLMKW